MSKFKFEHNLKKASNSNNIKDAKSEWVILSDELRDSSDRTCICQHKIKYTWHLVNKINGNIIYVGRVCLKKFQNISTDYNSLFSMYFLFVNA